ncbi:facilitated trehalose transporter Tret1-like isoform X2 [Danaus plexippus]|uniref:facilitated trehalose transporter Tret1-like isoform X2 n=1 Tax=Danaus plexippus TaxID=13037 RepID=UPI002AB1CDD7|nr:facilitated trehalose transporter Tret1-like isoform X2 [Danaus plexippus]
MAIINQVISTAMISYVCTSLGLLYTLPSSTVELFSSVNTTLDRVMTQTEISFMGSASSASSFLITPFVWYFLNKLGRKRTLILFHLPQLIAWIILVTINKVEAVLLAMFISGLSGSTFLIIPVFVSEYCEVSIRGAMMSGHIIFYELGIMISYFFGGFLEYKTIMYISLIMSAVALGMICCIRESPLYLIQKERDEEAVKSIQFYRGLKKNCSEISREVECIRKILNFDCGNNDSDEKQSLKKDDIPSEKLSFIQILTKSRTTRRIVFKLLFIQTVSIFQGLIVVQVFAKPLLQFAVPSMSATLSTVLFALVVAISSLIGAYLLDTVGRRNIRSSFMCRMVFFMQLYFAFHLHSSGKIFWSRCYILSLRRLLIYNSYSNLYSDS